MELLVLLIAWVATVLLATVVAMGIGHAADWLARGGRRPPPRGFDVLPLPSRERFADLRD
jgi:hypothetical protein